ncbi:hypothetical protein C4F49_14025 [Sphingobacterium sp. KB22]|uniref:Uncharacterized protein n=1 Tax=Sphingobacterium hungaricum TaxID=2082723 RepID=A0A928V285_9SPHI|nr:hypothetical protein [Sphingobacterium hungaricum]
MYVLQLIQRIIIVFIRQLLKMQLAKVVKLTLFLHHITTAVVRLADIAIQELLSRKNMKRLRATSRSKVGRIVSR